MVADNMVEMELRRHIAEGGDIELITFKELHQDLGEVAALLPHLSMVERVEIDRIRNIGDARHEEDPRIGGVLDQAYLAEGQMIHRMAVAEKVGMECEGHR